MKHDTLILLRPDFLDPAYPGTRFYRWHSTLLEGILHSFPALASRIEVLRVAWPRPRREVIQLLGEQHRSLPVLTLAEGTDDARAIGRIRGRAYITDNGSILAALAARHGIPIPNP